MDAPDKKKERIKFIKEAEKKRALKNLINEIESWLKELQKLKVSESTDIEKEEMVLLLRSMLKEITKIAPEKSKVLKHKINEAVSKKRKRILALKRAKTKKKKKINKKLDLKHYDGSIADKLLELVSERKKENIELIKNLLDRLWRKRINGETLTGKGFKAMESAQNFLREFDSK